MSIGKNTVQGKRLLEIIEESEAYDSQKKEIGELNTALMAAAKAEGFNTKAIGILKKRRKMKPHDRQEGDEIFHAYSHAIGMDDEEPPLFRAISEMAKDSLTRKGLLESMKELAPPEGDIILRMGGDPVRVYRDRAGVAQVEPFVIDKPKREPGAPKTSTSPSRAAREVPDVSAEGAFSYGQQMFRDNRPIIENPFPFGDPRRAKCDEGFRKESGSDGMGPDD